MKLIFYTLQNQYVKTILSGQATLTVIYAPVIIWITHIYSDRLEFLNFKTDKDKRIAEEVKVR